jgi:alkylation response protein AidB-like acyl-CoA dehydrogenase
MIELFGTQNQKKLFLKKLYTGQWTGTMLLTEPQAGSDVGALSTMAVKNSDGTYSLTGNKIFITSGEHDLSGNIIHPVLARIEGAPEGTKGISLFIVPKIWVNDDGSLGKPNDIVCTGVEEKMGFHGSATCSMTLGGKGECRGLLLGNENMGMRIMFHMMNEARLAVGFQGFMNASTAYLYAINYAKQRLQGKDLESAGDPNAPQVPIIRHPDVRRMLLWMKAYVEGMRSFLYYVATCFDRITSAETETERENPQGLVDLLTPIVKAYCSQRGFEVCVQAMQIYGGYGYTKEFPVEQLTRDCKLASIYEGTDGIQAMDLLRRKIGMKGGKVFRDFLQEIHKITDLARRTGSLEKLAIKVEEAANHLEETAVHLDQAAASPDLKVAFAFASPFLDVMGDVVMAWMLLWRAVVALSNRKKEVKKKDDAYYEGQLKNAEFFIYSILPSTLGKMEAIQTLNGAAIEISESALGG